MNLLQERFQLVAGVYYYRSPEGGVLSFSKNPGEPLSYHKMNSQAASMLVTLLAGQTAADIVQQLIQQHDLAVDSATHDVSVWLESLLAEHLIERVG